MKVKSTQPVTAPKRRGNGSSRPAVRASSESSLGKGQRGETNRRAAAVLEVLAGVRTSPQAS